MRLFRSVNDEGVRGGCRLRGLRPGKRMKNSCLLEGEKREDVAFVGAVDEREVVEIALLLLGLDRKSVV